jgi:hypothetical protein
MDGIKGVGKTLLSCQTPLRGRVDLVQFADGSVGVQQDQQPTVVWEPHERGEAMCVYWTLTGFGQHRPGNDGPDVILFIRRAHPQSAAMN